MALKFSPNGFLDLATDPSELPGEAQGEKGEISGAMRRCTNLVLNKTGIASTRDGSTVLNSSAMTHFIPYLILEQNGFRYCFNDTAIYRNEESIQTGMASAGWSAIKYNPYNSTIRSIYALNGKNRKRIEGEDVYEWGISPPTVEPVLNAKDMPNVVSLSYGEYRKTIRPIAPGDESNFITITGAEEGWECVDDEFHDDATTLVGNATHSELRDLYTMANVIGEGTIDYITVWMRCAADSAGTNGEAVATAKTALQVDGTVYEGDEETLSTDSTFADFFTRYTTNPATGLAWEWDDIDDLQAGVALDNSTANMAMCTQIWIAITYKGLVARNVDEDSGEAETDLTISEVGLSGNYNVKYTYARKEEDTVVCRRKERRVKHATPGIEGYELETCDSMRTP